MHARPMTARSLTMAAAVVVAALIAAIALGSDGVADAGGLAGVEARVESRFPDVEQIAPAELAAALAGPAASDYLLLDVREPDEFAVSHIAGAVRVPPGAWLSTVLASVGDRAKGRRVIFYCSVGQRSSELARSVATILIERGAKAVANLRGGIFGWHNRALPLVDARGPTELVHPYDETWGQLLLRRDLTRYQPRP